MKFKEKANYITLALIGIVTVYLIGGLIFPNGISYTDGDGSVALVRAFLPAFAVSFSILILGITFLALSELVVYKNKDKRDLSYLSAFAICIALWFLSSNELCALFFGNAYICQCLYHMLLPWAIGFMILELMENTRRPLPKWAHTLTYIPFVYGILCVVFDVAGMLDFSISTVPVQLLAIAVCIIIIVRSALSMVTNGFHPAERTTVFAIANLMMVYAALIDVIRVLVFEASDPSHCFRAAALTFMFVIGMDAIQVYAKEQSMLSTAGAIQSMALHDGLTGVYNRMAFNNKLQTTPLSEDVGFIHFDVNNLKEANDVYGHAEGDQLIKSIAHGIQKAFSDIGECYRYGGDEFTVITEHYNEDKIKVALGNLRIYLALMNRENLVHVRMSMACGYDHYHAGDENLFTSFERADEKMYENKRGMKELEERLARG